MNPVVALGLFAAALAVWWLASRMFENVGDVAFSAVLLPYRALLQRAADNRDEHALTTPQSFISTLPADEASQILATLEGVAEAAGDGAAAFHYRDRRPGQVTVELGTTLETRYAATVTVHPGDTGGSAGDVLVTSWLGDVDDALAAHHDLLDIVFPALHAVDPEFAVSTASARETAQASRTLVDPPPGAWPSHRQHTHSVLRHIPALPGVAMAVFTVGLVTALAIAVFGSNVMSGVVHTTTKSELCESYSTASAAMADDDKFDVTAEMNDLADKAKGYDDKGVRDDGDDVENLGRIFSTAKFASATSNVEKECS